MILVLAGFMVLSVVETSARHIMASDAAAPNVGRAIFFIENDCNCPRGIVDASSRQGTSLPSGEGFRDELHLHIMRLLPVGRATTGMPRHPTPISDRGALQKVTT
jgi:hypothetical protein